MKTKVSINSNNPVCRGMVSASSAKKKHGLSLRNIGIIVTVVIFIISLIHMYFILPNRVISLEEIKPELDAAENNCFREIRQNMDSEFVYMDNIDDKANILINKYDGYKTLVPNDWKLDNTNFQYVTVLYNNNFKLSIFREEIDLSYDTTQTYIDYSNYYIRQNYGTIILLKDYIKYLGLFQTQIIAWKREKILTINDDLNYYYESNIILNDSVILTFLLKSNQNKIETYEILVEEAISNLQLINQTKQSPALGIPQNISEIKLDGEGLSLRIPNNKCVFGVYHAPRIDYWKELRELENSVNFRFELIMDYYNFKIPFKQARENLLAIYGDQRFMLVTLQPFITQTAKEHDGSCLIPKIANGEYDAFLFEWACGLKELGEPVFLRFANEMNGDWAEWCSWFYSLDPDLYVMACSRIHTLFEKVGASNVYFVWNPHDRTYPDYNWNKEYLYYPGNSKVDCIGLTAYNNGVTRANEEWRDFDECYSELYVEYMLRYNPKPFIITEFACNEIGGDKAEWIISAFHLLKEKYPNIRAAVWWDGVDDRWIYNIDSTEQSQNAFKEAISDSYFQIKSLNPI
jgi:mannan endo-1,4-beta-mannosidase